jgi:hypothetical protein
MNCRRSFARFEYPKASPFARYGNHDLTLLPPNLACPLAILRWPSYSSCPGPASLRKPSPLADLPEPLTLRFPLSVPHPEAPTPPSKTNLTVHRNTLSASP